MDSAEKINMAIGLIHEAFEKIQPSNSEALLAIEVLKVEIIEKTLGREVVNETK